MSTDPPRGPLRSRLLRALPVLLLTLGFSVLLDRNEEAEWTALDFQARLRPVAAQSDVVVVRINDADHDTLFGGVTPLDPATVLRVVDAIARGHPTVIGVDLESGAPAYAVVPDSVRGVPVVWPATPAASTGMAIQWPRASHRTCSWGACAAGRGR